MRNTYSLLAALAVAVALSAGCAGPEEKFGRGLSNTWEFARGGEFEYSIEQAGMFDGYDAGMTYGVVHGIDRTFARTGMGIYEVVTAPIPPYGPVMTNYVSAKPVYPDSYQPYHYSDRIFDTDRETGFSGGDVFPFLPGGRFRVFDN
jgi:putative exosortase-associated protein (TIGR04073 family)